MTDPDTFDALGVIEEELAEDYVERTLPARDARRFEQHFLVDRNRRRYLAFVRLLKTYASSGVPAKTAAEGGIWNRFTEMFQLHPVRTALATLAIVTLVAGNPWFVSAPDRLRGELEQVRAQQARETELRKQLQDQVARLESQRTAAAQPSSFSLEPGLLRSEGTLARIAIPPSGQVVQLELRLPVSDSALLRSYGATLYDADGNGEPIWFQAKLRAVRSGERQVVTVLVPAQVLTTGDYQITLSTLSPSPAVQNRQPTPTIATYTFRVSPS